MPAAGVRPGHPRADHRLRRGRPGRRRSVAGPGCPSRSPASRSTGRSRSRWSARRRRRPVLHAVDVGLARRRRAPACGCRCAGPTSASARSRDIACFEPADSAVERASERASRDHGARATRSPGSSPRSTSTTIYAASPEESAFFRGLAEGRLLGQRCPTCRRSTCPPRGACPVDGVPTDRRGRAARHGHRHDVLHRQRAVPRPEDQAAVRLGVRPARRRRHRVPAPDPRHRRRRGADGHAGRGGVEAARGVGHHDREHQPLPADRRAGRGLRDLHSSTSERGGRHERRRSRRLRPATDAGVRRLPHVVELLVPIFARAATSRPAGPSTTSASGARARRTTWPAGRSRSSPRSTRSARCRRSTSRTSRWTPPGRCTRPG